MSGHLNEMPRVFETTDQTAVVITVDIDHQARMIDITIHARESVPNKMIAHCMREAAAEVERDEFEVTDLTGLQDP